MLKLKSKTRKLKEIYFFSLRLHFSTLQKEIEIEVRDIHKLKDFYLLLIFQVFKWDGTLYVEKYINPLTFVYCVDALIPWLMSIISR